MVRIIEKIWRWIMSLINGMAPLQSSVIVKTLTSQHTNNTTTPSEVTALRFDVKSNKIYSFSLTLYINGPTSSIATINLSGSALITVLRTHGIICSDTSGGSLFIAPKINALDSLVNIGPLNATVNISGTFEVVSSGYISVLCAAYNSGDLIQVKPYSFIKVEEIG